MGGAVSSGESNDELIDNLLESDYIKSGKVEAVFRAVDRALYYTEGNKSDAYKDVAWKDGNLHLSAPCIYSEVMENLELEQGMSFLNMGSGTGYLSTMCGLIIGRNGINHGIELHPEVAEYAREKLEEFILTSPAIDGFDFCIPQFVVGNVLDQISSQYRYDRIYCGAACPEESIRNVTDLLKIGGICVMPINDSLVQITRTSEEKDERKSLLPVSFTNLVQPSSRSDADKKLGTVAVTVALPEVKPLSLKELCRLEIRSLIRSGFIPTGSSSGGRKKRKRRRAARQERRLASRLLVVQRRRPGGENGETGFVAVAYSLGDNSTEEEIDGNDDHMAGSSGEESHEQNAESSDDQLPDLENEAGQIIPVPPVMDTSNNGAIPTQSQGTTPTRSTFTSARGAQVREILSRARAAATRRNNNTASNGIGGNEQGPPPPTPPRPALGPGSDTFLRRIRELYRRREQRAGFRQISGFFNAVSSAATNSVLVRSANNSTSTSTSSSSQTEPNQNQSTNTVGIASTTVTASTGIDGSRTGASTSKREHSTSQDDSYCLTDSSLDSSSCVTTSTLSNTSSSEDMEDKNGDESSLRPKTDHRVSASAESGVATDSPERKDGEEGDLEQGQSSVEKSHNCKKNKKLKKKKKVGNNLENPPQEEEEMETGDEDNSDYAKSKMNPISARMQSTIEQLPLPPPVKLYLNFYRQNIP